MPGDRRPRHAQALGNLRSGCGWALEEQRQDPVRDPPAQVNQQPLLGPGVGAVVFEEAGIPILLHEDDHMALLELIQVIPERPGPYSGLAGDAVEVYLGVVADAGEDPRTGGVVEQVLAADPAIAEISPEFEGREDLGGDAGKVHEEEPDGELPESHLNRGDRHGYVEEDLAISPPAVGVGVWTEAAVRGIDVQNKIPGRRVPANINLVLVAS